MKAKIANDNPEPEFSNVMPGLVSDIFAYLNNRLTDAGLSVASLSEELHHNCDYLSRCFHKTTGIALQQYLIAKRVTLAQKLLREGRSLTESCYSAGFQSYSSFSRAFSNQTGMTPRQYQQQELHTQCEKTLNAYSVSSSSRSSAYLSTQ